jgi:hypothetical protein
MERITEKAFLIKLDANTFVKLIDGNTITTSTVPSACPALAYDEADAIARLLRRRRFGAAYVSDLLGHPITAAMLREAQDQALVQEEDLPKTHEELDAIPSKEQLRRYRTESAFKERYDELESTPREAAKARR